MGAQMGAKLGDILGDILGEVAFRYRQVCNYYR